MDYCAHLLHECIGTRTFRQPAARKLLKYEAENHEALAYTDIENTINQRRCKKQQFYVKVFKHEKF